MKTIKRYNACMKAKNLSEQKEYWLNEFKEEVPVLDIPSDYIRPKEESFKEAMIFRKIEKQLGEKINSTAGKTGTTEYMIFLSAAMITLSKYSRQEDIVIGSLISGRTHKHKDKHVNILAMRGRPKGNKEYIEFLQEIKESCIKAYENQEYPFEELIEELDIRRDMSRNPLFDVMLVFKNNEEIDYSLNDIRIEYANEKSKIAKLDLTFNIYEFNGKFEIGLEYCTDLFKEESAERILTHYIRILEQITENVERKIREIDAVTEEERTLILKTFNDTKTDYLKDKTVVALFEEQVEKTPDNTALIFEDKQLTYAELNRKVNQVAIKLRELGVKPDDFVAIMAERSIEMIVGIYGIIKAGGAYVPIDPNYPRDRIKYMIEECAPKVILVYRAEVKTKIPVINLEEKAVWEGETANLEKVNNPNDLAYCIYTSGTTGKPKGVMVEHKGIINMKSYYENKVAISKEDKILQFANIVFSASVPEMTMAILIGGSLVIVPDSIRLDEQKVQEYAQRNKVTVATLPPNYYMQMNDFQPRIIIIAGSESNGKLIEKTVNSKYINSYGLTENTVCATHWEYKNGEEIPKKIPIGRPISNVQIYILNENSMCGIGVPGELCIAGAGVARGYLNGPELTAEKFVDNPYGEGKLYRTGDLARWLPDGNIEYLGRMDEQVKIRGFRIELGEIESVLRKIDKVKDTVAIVREDEDKEKSISAYIVSDEEITVSEIRKELEKTLPDYMIPTYMMQIENIPVTRNGKLDKKALPKIKAKSEKEYIASRNDIEEKIVAIFKEILGVEKVGIKDDFFELGGHSLRATRVINRVEVATGVCLSVKNIFENPTVEGLSRLVSLEKGEKYKTIPKTEKKDYYMMSSAQKRIYLIQQMGDQGTVYNMPQSLRLRGKVNLDSIKNAMQELINRHEILRTEFLMINGEPVQRIQEYVKADFEFIEDKKTDEEDIIDAFIRPFDLEKAPLFRVKLVKREECYLFLIDMNHIISDGMSMGTFMKEFSLLYNENKLEPLTHQYKDYSEWMKTRDLAKQKEYWVNEFKEEIPVLDMPLDYARQKEQSFKGAMIFRKTKKELGKKINSTAGKTGTTEYMIFLSAAMITLSKYSRQEDIVIGSPISGRTHKDTEGMLGMFVNTLAMRGYPERNKEYIEFLQEIKESCIRAYENQEYPFEELVEELDIRRDMSRNPLFDVMLVLQNNEEINYSLNDVRIEYANQKSKIAKFDLTFNIYETDNEVVIGLEYCSDLFKEESAERILEHYERILDQITENVEIKISEIEAVTAEERNLILNTFNDTKVEYPKDKTVVDLFEEQVEKTPDNTALVFEDKQLTYTELNRKVNQLARKLRELGVKPDDFVAIMAERSIEMIVGIYGIIKAGGAYVPIDSNYPKDRIKYMLEDCMPKAILLYKAEVETKIPIINLEDKAVWEGETANLEKVNKPNDLAYCIYTSGTTGRPKGVMIEHKSLNNHLQHIKNHYLNEKELLMPLFTSVSFDLTVPSIFTPLISGKIVVICNTMDTFKDILFSGENKYIIKLTPSHLRLLKEMKAINKSIKRIIVGGEELTEKLAKSISKLCENEIEIINEYGPTEATVGCTLHRYNYEGNYRNSVLIGKPISNIKIFIVDSNYKLLPIGVPGEICIGGVGVARGYLNRPELTAEKFVDNPYGEGKLYRTGDLARWLPDGNIEYLGRIDEQVKIRGFRIELGEIESALRKIDKVKDAVVIVREDENKEKSINAYIVSDEEITVSEIREELEKTLPDYMIPAYIMQIENIPVTANGKLDKKALPKIEAKSEKEYIAPRNDIEEKVVSIFEEILGVDRVGIKDSFFEFGGDSIKAIRVVSKMREAGYDVSVKDVMKKYTVEAIADSAVLEVERKYEQGEITGAVITTPIIETFEGWKLKKPHHFNQAMMIKVNTDNEKEISKVLDVLVKHHDVLRSVYRNKKLEILSMIESRKYDLNVYDLKNENNTQYIVEKECGRLQGSIDLENGPLMKVGLFKTDNGNYMMICIHHLAVDGVSWRILLEDFNTVLTQLKNGEEIVLPRKTASYKDWGEALSEYKNSNILKKETEYWSKVVSNIKDGEIKGDSRCSGSGYGNINISFSKSETKDLMYNAGRAFNTEINDLLISALGISVKKLTGQNKVAVVLEGHGREEIHKKIDIDRTVGWFTSMYPIIVECTEDIQESIVSTKEMLRKVPNHGMGYGLLKSEFEKVRADIYFNYLGEMDAENKNSTDYSSGISTAEENRLPGTININGSVIQDKLSFSIMYDKNRYMQDTIEEFSKLYRNSLNESVMYCVNKEQRIRTMSDYSKEEITKEDFEVLTSYFNYKKAYVMDIYSLTPLQEGILYQRLLDNKSSNYVIQKVFAFSGKIDEEKIQDALKLLGRKHDVLRTVIMYEKISKPRQVVLKNREIEYKKEDLSKLNKAQQNKKVLEIEKLDVKRGFNLQKDKLMRIKYIVLDDESSKLIWTIHHIIVDGWCWSIIFGDFMRYYKGLKAGKSISEMERRVDKEKMETAEYGEYISWVEKQDKEEGIEYWKELLSDYDGVAEIKPIKKTHPTEEQVKEAGINVPKETSEKLFKVARLNNVTINNIVEAAWGIVLQRYNGTNDVVFGKVVSGRNADIKGIEKTVGLFINTIPFRVKCDERTTIRTLLKELKQQGIDGNSYDYCSLAEIQNETQQKSDLIKTIFAFENYYVDESNLSSGEGALQIKYEAAREQTNYAITLGAYANDEQLMCSIMYNPNEYDKGEIEIVLNRLEKVLVKISKNEEVKVSDIEVITEDERELILNTFNDTKTDYPKDKTLVELFEEQVKKTPDNTAVVFEDKQLTYAELNRKVNRVARKLRELNVKPNDFVAIIAERSIEMIVGIYGIIKAGGAYVPIDPKYPEDRIKYMIQDCKPKAILVYKAGVKTKVPVINLEEKTIWECEGTNFEKVNKPNDLACCIYTSGTTGKPKGTMIEHKSIIRLVKNSNYFRFEDVRMLQTGSISFDAATFEIWGTLLNAGRLYLANKNEFLEIKNLKRIIEDNNINTMFLTTALFNQIVSIDCTVFNGLKTLMFGGEKSSEIYVRKLLTKNKKIKLVNLYGPTETTTLATWYPIEHNDIKENIPIGKPVSNTEVYILRGLQLCGIGMPGELCITGVGVARGYLNRPELTAEKFVDNPYGEGKMYRTGDLARWLPDGNIEYLGRIDEQVKIRGFRIELGEIESALRKIDRVKDAVVIVREDENKEKSINAYIVSDEEINVSEIREELEKNLPDYMIPAYMMQIENIPVTRNGKLDKKALPKIEVKSEKEYIAPRNDIEVLICTIFSKVLNVKKVGINDDFFELGGHSLLAIKFEVEMNNYNFAFKVRDIFKYKTPYQIENYITGEEMDIKDLEEDVNIPEKVSIDCNDNCIDNIEPFNDIFYKNCYYNALFPVIKHYNKNILLFLINDVLVYDYNAEKAYIDIQYIGCNSMKDILYEEGIDICGKDISNDIIDDIIKAIKKESPVIITIDCYYSSIRQDTYKKIHWSHALLVYGFNLNTKKFNVIEHSHKDNLTYSKATMSFEDLQNSYLGYIKNFSKKEPTYFEIVNVKENKSNMIAKDELDKLQKKTLIKNILLKKEDLYKGLNELQKFVQMYSDVIINEKTIKEKVESYVEGINHIINAKYVEKYRIEHVLGKNTTYYKKNIEIIELWENVRIYLGRYMYSGKFIAENFKLSVEKMYKIIEKEKEFIEMFVDSIISI